MTNPQNTAIFPVIHKSDGRWILLSTFSNGGTLRADRIDGPDEVVDSDGHHTRQVRVKTSIKYKPKIWS